jgi:tripartite-type tricarboxylate transporter receptor subunit TctC
MHLAGELFMRETGAQMVHVPYNAPGTATTNLIAGDIQLMFQLIPASPGR